jgi:PAS domain S-box-containing protein
MAIPTIYMPPPFAATTTSTEFRQFQMRFLEGLLLFTTVLAAAFLLMNLGGWIEITPGQRYLVWFESLAFVAMVFILRRSARAYVPVAAATCALMFLLFAQALLVAQVNELRIVWLLMVTGAAYMLLGRAFGHAVAVCTLVLVWSVNALHVTPYTPQALLGYSSVLLVMCFGCQRYIRHAMALYRQLGAREAQFRLLTEGTSDAVWRADRNNMLTYVSPGDERMRGVPAQEMLGRPIAEMFTAAGVQLMHQAMQAQATQFIAPVKCRDGTERWIEIVAEREIDDDGTPLGLHGRSRDVTERLRLEAELHRHRADLEVLVQERTADLSVAREAAEAATRAKNIFLSNISHELRTPLTLILGMSELARARVADLRSQQLLDQVLTQARKLTALITDLIDYSALGAKRMELRRSPLVVAPLMQGVHAALDEAASAKGLALILEIAPEVAQTSFLGDARRLRQVLMQLADNAIKFTTQGRVVLRVLAPRSLTAESVELHFEVEDTGVGIEPADQWLLFHAFEQADGTATRKHEGTGLGLALCKLLVQAMNGHIRVTSQPGEGSTFHFAVQLGTAAADTGLQPLLTDQRSPGVASALQG